MGPKRVMFITVIVELNGRLDKALKTSYPRCFSPDPGPNRRDLGDATMLKIEKHHASARPISMDLIDLRAAFLPCAVLTSFVVSLVGLTLAIDAATKHLVI